MDYVLLISVLVLITALVISGRRWLHWLEVADSQAKEIRRLKEVALLHCDQIDTLQKEKKGWQNKNKLLNDTNDKLVQRNMELDKAVGLLQASLIEVKHDAADKVAYTLNEIEDLLTGEPE